MQAHQSSIDPVQAYNLAFVELGLDWHWHGVPAAAGSGAQAIRRYVEQEHPHLLRAYDADFLVQAIESARERCLAQLQQR